MISRIAEIFGDFKRFCASKGWQTSDGEDWIESNGAYDSFLWAKNVSPTSFKAIISDRKCVVQKGLFYDIVEPSHVAWLFTEPASENLTQIVMENPDFSKHVAIFDFSPMHEGKNRCIKLNNTDSNVFREFESFLEAELQIKVEPLTPNPNNDNHLVNHTLPELA